VEKTENIETEDVRRSVFITDGAGVLGQAVTRLLTAAGHKVTGMTSGKEGALLIREAGGLPVYVDSSRVGEIRATLAMAKADTVLHLAPQAFNLPPFRTAKYGAQTLQESTAALLDAAQAADVKYVVYAGSAFVYGDTGGQQVDESAPLTSHDDEFVRAAIKAEKMVTESFIPACVLRAGYVYGPGLPEMAALADTLRSGRPVFAGENTANWIHSDDLARALLLAVEKQPENAVCNVVDDRPASPQDFVRYLASALGIQEPVNLPGVLARALLSKTALTLMNFSTSTSNAAARERLGWEPRYSTHREGIEQMLLTWRAEMVVES
jgi:nucleoside-diphosphate-sugar epimerase